MSDLLDLSWPRDWCRNGDHGLCRAPLCGCIADHPDDTDMLRGFKRLKRSLHPERESQVAGGWS